MQKKYNLFIFLNEYKKASFNLYEEKLSPLKEEE